MTVGIGSTDPHDPEYRRKRVYRERMNGWMDFLNSEDSFK